jgi:hypothetical protein
MNHHKKEIIALGSFLILAGLVVSSGNFSSVARDQSAATRSSNTANNALDMAGPTGMGNTKSLTTPCPISMEMGSATQPSYLPYTYVDHQGVYKIARILVNNTHLTAGCIMGPVTITSLNFDMCSNGTAGGNSVANTLRPFPGLNPYMMDASGNTYYPVNYGSATGSGCQFDLALNFGQNLTVPANSTTYFDVYHDILDVNLPGQIGQCSDGVNNDSFGGIDTSDPDCVNSNGWSEYDIYVYTWLKNYTARDTGGNPVGNWWQNPLPLNAQRVDF